MLIVIDDDKNGDGVDDDDDDDDDEDLEEEVLYYNVDSLTCLNYLWEKSTMSVLNRFYVKGKYFSTPKNYYCKSFLPLTIEILQ